MHQKTRGKGQSAVVPWALNRALQQHGTEGAPSPQTPRNPAPHPLQDPRCTAPCRGKTKKGCISLTNGQTHKQKKPKNITETRKSSSSTFIAAIQRFNNATKGLLTLKGVWGGRGKCWVFFSEHKAIATSSALLHLHGTERSKFSTGLMAKPNQKTADTPLE